MVDNRCFSYICLLHTNTLEILNVNKMKNIQKYVLDRVSERYKGGSPHDIIYIMDSLCDADRFDYINSFDNSFGKYEEPLII